MLKLATFSDSTRDHAGLSQDEQLIAASAVIDRAISSIRENDVDRTWEGPTMVRTCRWSEERLAAGRSFADLAFRHPDVTISIIHCSSRHPKGRPLHEDHGQEISLRTTAQSNISYASDGFVRVSFDSMCGVSMEPFEEIAGIDLPDVLDRALALVAAWGAYCSSVLRSHGERREGEERLANERKAFLKSVRDRYRALGLDSHGQALVGRDGQRPVLSHERVVRIADAA
jgi:hypothetical protein